MGIMQTHDESAEAKFGSLVRERRDEMQMSQTELARRASEQGISLDASAISRIESGARSVRINEAVALAAILHIDVFSERFVKTDSANAFENYMLMLSILEADLERTSQKADSIRQRRDEAFFTLEALLRDTSTMSDDELLRILTALAIKRRERASPMWTELLSTALDAAGSTFPAELIEELRSPELLTARKVHINDRSGEPDDVFEREVLALFEAENGKYQTAP